MTKLERYTSVGCYPIFYIEEGWKALCPDCAEESEETLEKAVNWENDTLYCEECDCRVESAYNEPDTEEEEVNDG